MTLDGEVSIVHAFGSYAGDGSGPTSPLLQADDGRLYSTTNFGGPLGQGAVFRIAHDGTLTVWGLGTRPSGGLVQASNGNFYGTAFYGGSFDKGWVYRLTPSGRIAELHSFSGADGANPDGELILDTGGRLLGVTQSGGTANAGVAFRIGGKLAPGGQD